MKKNVADHTMNQMNICPSLAWLQKQREPQPKYKNADKDKYPCSWWAQPVHVLVLCLHSTHHQSIFITYNGKNFQSDWSEVCIVSNRYWGLVWILCKRGKLDLRNQNCLSFFEQKNLWEMNAYWGSSANFTAVYQYLSFWNQRYIGFPNMILTDLLGQSSSETWAFWWGKSGRTQGWLWTFGSGRYGVAACVCADWGHHQICTAKGSLTTACTEFL